MDFIVFAIIFQFSVAPYVDESQEVRTSEVCRLLSVLAIPVDQSSTLYMAEIEDIQSLLSIQYKMPQRCTEMFTVVVLDLQLHIHMLCIAMYSCPNMYVSPTIVVP